MALMIAVVCCVLCVVCCVLFLFVVEILLKIR